MRTGEDSLELTFIPSASLSSLLSPNRFNSPKFSLSLSLSADVPNYINCNVDLFYYPVVRDKSRVGVPLVIKKKKK